jgi:hypothetical protein
MPILLGPLERANLNLSNGSNRIGVPHFILERKQIQFPKRWVLLSFLVYGTMDKVQNPSSFECYNTIVRTL